MLCVVIRLYIIITYKTWFPHGTSKHTELRNARNFENVFEVLMYLIIPEPII